MKALFFLLALLSVNCFGQNKGKDIISDTNEYNRLLNEYKSGRKDFSKMPTLVHTALSLKDSNTARVISKDYIDNYLFNLNPTELYTSANLQFIGRFTKQSMEHGFKFLFKNSSHIDSIIGIAGYSTAVVDHIIKIEEVAPYLQSKNNVAKKQDWRVISKNIERKYSKMYADRIILDSKLEWAAAQKDTSLLIKYNVEKIDRFGIDSSFIGRVLLNNMIYEIIFMHSNDPIVLKKAIKWMEELLRKDPLDAQLNDTYASLLYKTGNVQDALKFSQKAMSLMRDAPDIQENYNRMKRGEITWK